MSRIEFNVRPSSVLPEHRRMYKISQILLVLENASRGGKSSLPRLQLFNWAFKSQEREQRLVQASEGSTFGLTAWGFDPALIVAIRFALADQLITETTSGYQITEKGRGFAKVIANEAGVLTGEKSLLARVKRNITETMISDVTKGWEF